MNTRQKSPSKLRLLMLINFYGMLYWMNLFSIGWIDGLFQVQLGAEWPKIAYTLRVGIAQAKVAPNV